MLIVLVDTATPAITAALAEVTDADVRVLAARVTVDPRAHGELLAPAIDAVLRAGDAAPGDLAAVVAGVGPGPFTGLRVGLVTAAAMADALRIPAYGVGTLDALGRATTGRVLVATDARRKEVYWGVYADGRPIAGPAVGRPEEIAVEVDRAVGDGARRYAQVLRLAVEEPWYPPAEALASLAAGRIRDKAPGEPLTPLYLRRPDAVEPGTRKAVLP